MNKLKLTAQSFTWEMGKWSLWYLPIMAVIYFILTVFIREEDFRSMSFMVVALNSNAVFMLVIGILSAYLFLKLFIDMGVTRKIYIQALSLSGAVIVIFLTVLSSIFALVFMLVPWIGANIPDFEGSFTVYLLGNLLRNYTAFIAGSVISIGFYRGFLPGMFGVLLTAVVVYGEMVLEFLDIYNFTVFTVLLFIMLIILFIVNYMFTKRVPIKF